MKQSAFAALLSVSQQMVSKYAARGLLVIDGREIDATASLEALEGHVDEAKRTRALSLLSAAASSPVQLAAPRAPAATKTGKALRDEIDAELRSLDLAERKGELVRVADVDERAREAITLFRESRANRRRDVASRLCAQFGLAAERVPALTRYLASEDEADLGLFARAMIQLAGLPPASSGAAAGTG